MNISELVQKAHGNAVNKGFYESKDKNTGELLMLIVSELGEALEAHRKHGIMKPNLANIESLFIAYDRFSKPEYLEEFQVHFERHVKDTFSDELADAVIRICDMCGYLGIDLEKHIELKMKYNETRGYKHGKRY